MTFLSSVFARIAIYIVRRETLRVLQGTNKPKGSGASQRPLSEVTLTRQARVPKEVG
jgi:hypothetical protein